MKADSVIPLSLSQQNFLHPRSNINLSIHFEGTLCVPALCRALASVMRRHEGLRARVVVGSTPAYQHFVEAGDLYDLPVISVEKMSTAEKRIKARLLTPVDLEHHGPLYAELIKIGQDEHVLLLVVHHVATDPHADNLFIRELLAFYDHFINDRVPDLPPAMQLSDYVQHELQSGEKLTHSQVEYWRSVLTGACDVIPRRQLPSLLPAGKVSVMTSSIMLEEARRLETFSSSASASLAATLYTAILLAVARQYCATDVISTIAYSGRDSHDLASLGASTVRFFPLRLLLDTEMRIGELVKKVQSDLICGAMASRAPFTPSRAIAQIFGEPTTADGARAAERNIHVCIVDALRVQPVLAMQSPNISAKRTMLGLQTQEVDEGSPFPEGQLVILLRKQFTAGVADAVTFTAVFHPNNIDESEVGKFLKALCCVCGHLARESKELSLGKFMALSN